MGNSHISFVLLLAAMVAMSIMIVTGQESNNEVPNSTIRSNTTLMNMSENLSTANKSATNIDNPETINSMHNYIFNIGGDAEAMPINSAAINASARDYEIPPPKKDIFVINGFSWPTKEMADKGQYLLNAAHLSRQVEATPHGYVTYNN